MGSMCSDLQHCTVDGGVDAAMQWRHDTLAEKECDSNGSNNKLTFAGSKFLGGGNTAVQLQQAHSVTQGVTFLPGLK